MKIYLAGAELPAVWLGWRPQAQTNVFVSFYQPRVDAAIKAIQRLKPHGLLTIDSGAHSFFAHYSMSASNRKIKKAAPDPRVYFKKYLEWLCSIRGEFDYFVELDIQEIVGIPQVKRWRKDFAAAGFEDKYIPVHHNCDSWKDFERLVAETPSRYVGIEGIRKGRAPLPYLKFIRYAFEHRCRIHGFAMIKKCYLDTMPFFSVDSSSWTTWYRYGKMPIFNDKTGWMSFVDIDLALQKKNVLIPGGKKPTAIRKGELSDYWLTMIENAYLRLERHVNDFWKLRGVDWDARLK